MTRPVIVRAFDEPLLPCGLYADELDKLSTFNAERGRGLVHDPEWRSAMLVLQARFDLHRDVMPESEFRAALGFGPMPRRRWWRRG